MLVLENWNAVMSIYQSSLFIDAELELAEAKETSAGAPEPLPIREDFAYCFGRILKAARGAKDERPAEAKEPVSAERQAPR